jgi:hypothetical protein
MEFLKIMEKFDGGNFHFWKFNMHMMLSKHGVLEVCWWKYNNSWWWKWNDGLKKKDDQGICITLWTSHDA